MARRDIEGKPHIISASPENLAGWYTLKDLQKMEADLAAQVLLLQQKGEAARTPKEQLDLPVKIIQLNKISKAIKSVEETLKNQRSKSDE